MKPLDAEPTDDLRLALTFLLDGLPNKVIINALEPFLEPIGLTITTAEQIEDLEREISVWQDDCAKLEDDLEQYKEQLDKIRAIL